MVVGVVIVVFLEDEKKEEEEEGWCLYLYCGVFCFTGDIMTMGSPWRHNNYTYIQLHSTF